MSPRFLRKCIWPRLAVLTLRNSQIVDSQLLSSTLPYLTNSRHIEAINLMGEHSRGWSEVSWICKMGYSDAREEQRRLNEDDAYFYVNNERVLRRVGSVVGRQKYRTSRTDCGTGTCR